MDDLRASLKLRLEKRKKNLARIRQQVEEGSLAVVQTHYAEIERAREALVGRGKAARDPGTRSSVRGRGGPSGNRGGPPGR